MFCFQTIFYHTMLINLFFPVICIFLAFGYAKIRRLVKVSGETWEYEESETFWITLMVKVLFLAFPGCSAASMQIFLCREINGVAYLSHDYRLVGLASLAD